MLATPSQLHLPQHGADAEDSGPLQDFRVRDPVLPSQLQYSAEAAEMEVIQLPGMVQVDGPGLSSVKECRQDAGLVHLQFGVQLHKALRQARLPHCFYEFWHCLKDRPWKTPESILDAHMERIAHFSSDMMSHCRPSNFEDGELEAEEEDCRGYILLEETEMAIENYSFPQDLPSGE
ncbi:unnamed protein product [Schistocephalus solidus]|uniref:RGS22 n=1 Tax=Schistocephalus solidus TaxID=70667 RepID=A0A183SW77_SCHSO|nr:unnamed protein product [Schistocephalus solidus]